MRHVMIGALCLAMGTMLGCQSDGNARSQSQHVRKWESVDHAVAVLQPTEGNDVSGVVHFYDVPGGVRIVADVAGLKPGSRHGFHVHEFGDITAPDGTSAGGHYNPQDMPHGRPGAEQRHAGDLGNLVADAEGVAHYERIDNTITIADLKNPVIGRGVVVHAEADNFTQPSGDAGGRIAVGVIGVAQDDSE